MLRHLYLVKVQVPYIPICYEEFHWFLVGNGIIY